MPRMYGDYDRACALHATAQGLDEPKAALKAAGFSPTVLQTGGFVMVLQAFKNERLQVWVTKEGETDNDNNFVVGAYRPTHSDEGVYDGDEELDVLYEIPLNEVPTRVRTFVETFGQKGPNE